MYHHGELKESLIKEGIKYVSTYGDENLSLRKLAAQCDVSHAAVYKHFTNKNDLLAAMKQYVKEMFVQSLQKSIEVNKEKPSEEILYGLAVAYVDFFIKNPEYYNFIYITGEIAIDFEHDMDSDYEPFTIFRDVADKKFEELQVPKERRVDITIGMWAVVHGLTEIAIMKKVKYAGDFRGLIKSILQNNFHIDGEKR